MHVISSQLEFCVQSASTFAKIPLAYTAQYMFHFQQRKCPSTINSNSPKLPKISPKKQKHSAGSELECKATGKAVWGEGGLHYEDGWFCCVEPGLGPKHCCRCSLSSVNNFGVHLDSNWLSLGPFQFGYQFSDSRPLRWGASFSNGHLSSVRLLSKLFQGLTLAKLWYKNGCFVLLNKTFFLLVDLNTFPLAHYSHYSILFCVIKVRSIMAQAQLSLFSTCKTRAWCLFISGSIRPSILVAAWLCTVNVRSFPFAASSQYETITKNRTSTPYFLANILFNAYLDQMDSRWREQAIEGWRNWDCRSWDYWENRWGQVSENWQHAVHGMPISHIGAKLKQITGQRRKEEAYLETLRPGDKKLGWNWIEIQTW